MGSDPAFSRDPRSRRSADRGLTIRDRGDESRIGARHGSGSDPLPYHAHAAHGNNATPVAPSRSAYLRVSIVGTTQAIIFQELGGADNDNAVWATATVDLTAWAGQTVRILIEAADESGASLVEAAIDDVKIVRQ